VLTRNEALEDYWLNRTQFAPEASVMHRYNEAMSEEETAPHSFEARLDELERTVKELEKGDLPLEESLSLFEAGMRLSAECRRQLEEAETRVEILMKKGTEVVPAPFNPEKTGK
jgi:exodeoxyribonuclease VII small subunit